MRVTFTRNELLYLDDQLTLSSKSPWDYDEESDELEELGLFEGNDFTLRGLSSSATIGATEDLLLKIGRGIVENQPTATLDLNEADLWRLRETAFTAVQIGQEKVGLNIKTKVYTALLSMRSASAAESVLDSIGLRFDNNSSEVDDRSYAERTNTTAQEVSGDNPDNDDNANADYAY